MLQKFPIVVLDEWRAACKIFPQVFDGFPGLKPRIYYISAVVVLYFFSNTSSAWDRKIVDERAMTASPLSKSSSDIHMALGLLAPKSDMMNVMFCPVFRCDWLKVVITATMFPHVATLNYRLYSSLFRKVLPKRTMSLLVFGASCKKPMCWKQCVVREIKTLYEVCMCFGRCAVIRQMGI